MTICPLRFKACKSVLSTNNPSVEKKKEHLLTKLTQLFKTLLARGERGGGLKPISSHEALLKKWSCI